MKTPRFCFFNILFINAFWLSMLFSFSSKAQNAVIQDVVKENNLLKIYYDLNGTSDFSVKLYISTDNAITWRGPLTKVSGDAGSSVFSGYGKVIFWDVLAEGYTLTEKNPVRFKIVTSTGAYEASKIIREREEKERSKLLAIQEENKRRRDIEEQKRIKRNAKRSARWESRDDAFHSLFYEFSGENPVNLHYYYRCDDMDYFSFGFGLRAGSGLFREYNYEFDKDGIIDRLIGFPPNGFSAIKTDRANYRNFFVDFDAGFKLFWPVELTIGSYLNLAGGEKLILCNVFTNGVPSGQEWIGDYNYSDYESAGGFKLGLQAYLFQTLLIRSSIRYDNFQKFTNNFSLGYVIGRE